MTSISVLVQWPVGSQLSGEQSEAHHWLSDRQRLGQEGVAHQPDEQSDHPAADGLGYQAGAVPDRGRCQTKEKLEQLRPMAVIHETCTQD